MDRADRTSEAHSVPSMGARPLTPRPGRSLARHQRRPGALAAFMVLPVLLAAACGVHSPPTGQSISGVVTGEVRAGVTITVTGVARSSSTTTNAAGAYSQGGLDNGDYVVTATLAGYSFAPHEGLQVKVAGADVGGANFISTGTHHAIRGTITGVVASGVRLELTGASTASTTSAADGSYAFPGIADGTYTVTPTSAGHGFSPGALTLTLSGADATGQGFVSSLRTSPNSIPVSVSGTVRAGVTVTLSGGTTPKPPATTDAAGAATFAGLLDGTYTVTPSLTGQTFTPHSLAVTLGGADAPVQRFTSSPSSSSAQVEELATGGRLAAGIAIGNDLNAWITDATTGVVSRVLLQDSTDGARGDVLDVQLGYPSPQPTAIALRFFGLRCFTDAAANRVGCLNFNGSEVFTVAIPTPASGAVDIVNGPGATPLSPDMWFAEHDAGKVGRLRITEVPPTFSGAIVAEFVLPAGCKPTALTWTDGNIWWAAEGCGRIGWIDRTTGAVHPINVDVGRPVSLASNLGEAGVWFIDAASDRLGRLSTTGGLSWFSPAVAGSQLTGVTTGPDKALYVTQQAGNSIARLPFTSFSPSADPNAGRLTEELRLPTAGAKPARITTGTDGNVWFTERGQAKIGVIYMSTHCIFGRVTLADLQTPVPLVTMTLVPAGGSLGTVTTDAAGDYIFCGLAAGSYTVSPYHPSRSFIPTSLSVTMTRSNVVSRSFVSR